MGVDYGTTRIGVALSDLLHITAQPFRVVEASAFDAQVMSIVAESDVERIVVGLPTHLQGRNDTAARVAVAFTEHLARITGLPVETVDERFTTAAAQSFLIDSGVRRGKRKEVVDKVAAAVLLQRWLDIQSAGESHDIV
jgi:putative Holliday junction resolvase